VAIEETIKELVSMGFDEQAAREAVQKARQGIQVPSTSAPVPAEVPTSAPQTSSAGRKRKSSADPATPGALGAAAAPERTFNVWTAEQLDALNAAAAEQGLTDAKMDDRWQAVAERVGHGRSASACRHRWATLQEGKGAAPSTNAALSGTVQPDAAKKTAAATWKSRKEESPHATKIFIGNARALGEEDEVIQFFASADDEDNRAGGILTELQWLSGKADGCCFARASSAAAAKAALALSGTQVSNGQQLLVQMAHEVSFKSVVPQLKTLRSGDSAGGVGTIGSPPQLPVPKGCRGVFLSNLSFELDEATLEWWCNDTVAGDGGEGEGTGGLVSAVRLLTADQASKKHGKDESTQDESTTDETQEEDGTGESASEVSQPQKKRRKQKHKHKHKHAGCAVVEFKHPAAPSIERMVAKHGSSLLSRPVAVKFARAEWKNNKKKQKLSKKDSGSKKKSNNKTDQKNKKKQKKNKNVQHQEDEDAGKQQEKKEKTKAKTPVDKSEETQVQTTSPEKESATTHKKKLRPRKHKKKTTSAATDSAEPSGSGGSKANAEAKGEAKPAK
jgi:hypothetical protein